MSAAPGGDACGGAVETAPGVVFGHAPASGGVRALRMDLHRPAGDDPAEGPPRPAVILAFGGAFHRGAREDDVAPEQSPTNTAVAGYCRRLAALGYVACAVDYRLAQEDAPAGPTPVLERAAVPLGRIDVVRGMLDLPPTSEADMRRAQEAATDDIAAAFRFVAGAARRLGVDPARIAVGGFSAGARIALAAALGEAIDPAAVVSLSGHPPETLLAASPPPGGARMAVLAVSGEDDLPHIAAAAPGLPDALRNQGRRAVWRVVPGHGHFYPAEAPTRDGESGEPAGTVFEEVAAFLAEALGAPPP